ncbi:MAG: hypothetical protein IH592_01865 [Bacteroidales bacterium]|nr:hypothetical protein [Bacteroidales bacterium]
MAGFIAVSDEIRKESYEAVKMLKKNGLKLFMITGDSVNDVPALAAGVLFSAGIIISPAIGAVFMSISTVIVAVNEQFLKHKMKTTEPQ